MMKTVTMMCAAAMLAVTFGAPAYAQDAMKKDTMMSSGSPMKMSKADQRKMASCQAMSYAMMMKNKGCMKMMKMHPDMMQAH